MNQLLMSNTCTGKIFYENVANRKLYRFYATHPYAHQGVKNISFLEDLHIYYMDDLLVNMHTPSG